MSRSRIDFRDEWTCVWPLLDGIAAPMGSRVWTAICVFAIVVLLIAVRGFDVRQLLLFVVPVLLALLMSSKQPPTRGTALAKVFLSFLAFGLLVAKLPWLFPKLGGVDPLLAAESDRLLAWYLAVYLPFFSFVVPCHYFTSELQQHRLGKPASLSRFTCRLGLATAFVLAPGMMWVTVKFLHLLPVL